MKNFSNSLLQENEILKVTLFFSKLKNQLILKLVIKAITLQRFQAAHMLKRKTKQKNLILLFNFHKHTF